MSRKCFPILFIGFFYSPYNWCTVAFFSSIMPCFDLNFANMNLQADGLFNIFGKHFLKKIEASLGTKNVCHKIGICVKTPSAKQILARGIGRVIITTTKTFKKPSLPVL